MSNLAATADETNGDFLLKTLMAGEALIFLGPDVASLEDGSSFRKAFVNSLDIENNPLIASYYEGDELFLFPDAMAQSKVYYKMQEFYQQAFQKELYQQIAELPCKLIVNASPDRFLGQTLGENKHSFAFFHKNDPGEIIPNPSLKKPLVYNLVGSLEAEESLLFTHDDLYDFLQAMLSGKGLPESLRDHIFSARSLIFLGFRFEKWYVQLLLRLLKVQDIRSRFARYATQQKYNADTLSICLDQFKIEFVSQDVPAFIAKLHNACAQANALRPREVTTATPKETILQWVKEDKLEEALDLLEEIAKAHEDPEINQELTMLQGRYYRLGKRIRQGIISPQDAAVERAKISKAILGICEEL